MPKVVSVSSLLSLSDLPSSELPGLFLEDLGPLPRLRLLFLLGEMLLDGSPLERNRRLIGLFCEVSTKSLSIV